MIKASKALVAYIEAYHSIEGLAEEFGVSRQTIYNIKKGENVSSEMIQKLMEKTGFDFEGAFETVAEHPTRRKEDK